jgi:hypothetical protein
MSRWLEAARRAQDLARYAAAKTDRTDRAEVSSVLSVLAGGYGSEIDKTVATDFAVPDSSGLLSDYPERSTLCGDAGERGASLDALVERQVQYWRSRLLHLDEPDNRRLKEVVPHCISCLDQPWLHSAVQLGWAAPALFGLDPAAPTILTRNGLVIGLVLTSLKRPLEVLEIAADRAIIGTGAGPQLSHFKSGRSGPPVWEHAVFKSSRSCR